MTLSKKFCRLSDWIDVFFSMVLKIVSFSVFNCWKRSDLIYCGLVKLNGVDFWAYVKILVNFEEICVFLCISLLNLA